MNATYNIILSQIEKFSWESPLSILILSLSICMFGLALLILEHACKICAAFSGICRSFVNVVTYPCGRNKQRIVYTQKL